jgi:hypothetical protein
MAAVLLQIKFLAEQADLRLEVIKSVPKSFAGVWDASENYFAFLKNLHSVFTYVTLRPYGQCLII